MGLGNSDKKVQESDTTMLKKVMWLAKNKKPRKIQGFIFQ
jgi:hypothetical protein